MLFSGLLNIYASVTRKNTPVSAIIAHIQQICPLEQFHTKNLSNVIRKLFLNIVQSIVRRDGNKEISFRLDIVNSLTSNSSISFENIYRLIPDDWFVVRKNNLSVTCGYTFEAKCNGQNVTAMLTLNSRSRLCTPKLYLF